MRWLVASLMLLMAGCAATKDIVATIPNPVARNWEVEETRLAEDVYRLDLRMKRFHTGGAGEARQVVHAHAEQLGRARGGGEYVLLEYTEGVGSPSLGAQRLVMAKIRLISGGESADSFGQNGRQ